MGGISQTRSTQGDLGHVRDRAGAGLSVIFAVLAFGCGLPCEVGKRVRFDISFSTPLIAARGPATGITVLSSFRREALRGALHAGKGPGDWRGLCFQ